MIDLDSKGYVTAPQLQEVLQRHGLFCHKDDINTFVLRYDLDSDGRLLYTDFCDAFTPNNPYYATMVNSRPPFFIHQPVPKLLYFNPETRDCLMQCFRIQFELEESIELIKQRLSRRPKYNMNDAFAYLDCFSIGFLSLEGIRNVLAENKVYPTDDDLKRLADRFDKSHNGRISYQEFMDEIMPKNSLSL